MKGVIHIIEVAVAGMLIMVALGMLFSAQAVKLNWERSDLISIASAGMQTFKYGTPVDKFDQLFQPNIEYGIRIEGIPKANVQPGLFINVGCIGECGKASSILTAAYNNGYDVTFSIHQTSLSSDWKDYDAMLLINISNFTEFKNKSIAFTSTGKPLIYVNKSSLNNDFMTTFNLTYFQHPLSNFLYFPIYDPKDDKVLKYFYAFGFNLWAPNDVEGADRVKMKSGEFYLWGKRYNFNMTRNFAGGPAIIVEDAESCCARGWCKENDKFTLTSPDGLEQNFRVKKIFYDSETAHIHPVGDNFTFVNFGEDNVIGQNSIIKSTDNKTSPMARNKNLIWISDFPQGEEYKTLLKAGIASNLLEWYLKYPKPDRETASGYVFIPLCCDAPEIGEFSFILWYSY